MSQKNWWKRTRACAATACALLALLALLAAGCSEEKKKPQVSANLCLYMPDGNVLGPYDTKEACATANENMPRAQCRPCEKKAN